MLQHQHKSCRLYTLFFDKDIGYYRTGNLHSCATVFFHIQANSRRYVRVIIVAQNYSMNIRKSMVISRLFIVLKNRCMVESSKLVLSYHLSLITNIISLILFKNISHVVVK